MPLVSVLLPVYNARHDLPRAMKSLQNQTFHDFEIIAIDDGSMDGSGDLLEEQACLDPRLRVFHQPNAGALGKVLNRAAELATGKYLARHDADDASTPNRIEAQVNYLESHPETGLCGTWAWYIDAELGPLFSYELPDGHDRIIRYLEDGQNPLVHGSVMLRRELFEKIGGYRGSYSEDFDLWLRLGEITKLGTCQNLGYYYWRSIGGINTGAHLRQEQLTQLAIRLHQERIQFGQERTNWQANYAQVIAQNTTENDPRERETTMFYARGLALMRYGRYHEAHATLQKAAIGKGIFAAKARRNLSFSGLFPLLSLAYRMMELREPIRYSRSLPLGTTIPL